MHKLRIAVDIGGTFTDGVAINTGTDQIWVGKSLTTYDDPGKAVSAVIDDLLGKAKASLGADAVVEEVVHGTTLVTNTLIERRGAKTALICTSGTADVLDIRREFRYDLYDLELSLPPALVDAEHRFEISGRTDSRGEILAAIAPQAIREIAEKAKAAGVESLAVTLLHSYANAEQEHEISEKLKSELPGIPVSCSADLSGEMNEYERTSTTAANAYVKPAVQNYLNQLQGRVDKVGKDVPLRIMVSSGGFVSTDMAANQPIQLLESGPAAGVISAINVGKLQSIDNLLAFDMGGTTAKASVVVENEAQIIHSFECARVHKFKKGSGLPILVPSIDLIEIGAGGGSIAHLNQVGLLNVGPKSATSTPGPACYGLGGTDATVTDADLVLGYLAPDNFLGGEMKLDAGASLRALGMLGEKLQLEPLEVAAGIYEIVNENMAAAARVHVAEKGYDPREFTLVATGGAGPVHAVEVARKLGIKRVLSPVAAGAGSCLGMLAAPSRVDRSWSKPSPLGTVAWDEVSRKFDELKSEALDEIGKTTSGQQAVNWRITLDMRYVGQGGMIQVTLDGVHVGSADVQRIEAAFEKRYESIYGRTVPNSKIEVITWRITAETAKQAKNFVLGLDSQGASTQPVSIRDIYIPARKSYAKAPVYKRYALPPGAKVAGPAVLEERESTIVIPVAAEISILSDLTVDIQIQEF